MSYIGNTNSVQQYSPQIAYFSGDASTVAFTLPVSVVSAAQIIVAVANVIQNPSSAFTVSGTTLTFTSAPPSGTNNIWVQYTTLQTNIVQPAAASVGPTQINSNYSLWNLSGSTINYTAGNVGIGTASPGHRLTVKQTSGDLQFAMEGVAKNWNLRNQEDGTFGLFDNSSNYWRYMYDTSNNHIWFGSTQTESMRITATGDIRIGYNQATSQSIIKTFATSHASGNRGGELFFGIDDGSTGGVRVKTVASSNASYNSQYVSIETHEGAVSAGERVRVVPTGGTRFACESFASLPSSTNWGVEINNTGSGSRFFGQGTGTETQIEFGNRNGTRGSIQTTSGGTSYNTTSDYRLKENIVPMTGALAKVAQLNPVTYNWKIGGSGQGFIAHELQAVVPDAVTGEKDAVDENDEPKYQMVDTSFLVATLTAAIQEQQALIESLTERITALESK